MPINNLSYKTERIIISVIHRQNPYHTKILLETFFALIGSFSWFGTINLGWSIVYIEGSQVKNFQIKTVFLSLKSVFVLADPADAAYHCLPKNAFWRLLYTNS